MSHPSDLSFTRNTPAKAEQEDDSIYDESSQAVARERVLRQAYEIIAILQKRLNEDVARLIVLQTDLAEVWRERQRPSDILSIMELNSPQPCFISSKIIKGRPIQRIDFRVEAHDQGWVTHLDGGSWSWFDVCVVPKTDIPISGITDTSTDRTWDIRTIDSRSGEPASAYHKDHELSSVATNERGLCRNTIASRDFEVQQISWTVDSEDADEATWVKSLQPDQRIMIRAWAKYGGWSNHVRSVSISLHTTPLL